MKLLGSILVLTGVMYGLQDFFRRAPAWVSLATFSVMPLALTPYWISIHQDVGVFPWIKLYSIVLSVSWLTALRATSLGRHKRPVIGLVGLLALNVIEAMALDATGGHFAHWLVFLTGALLLATLPSPKGCKIAEANHGEYLYPAMTRAWVVEYSVWNWTFLYLNFPIIAGQHVAVLGAALIVGVLEPQRWLQARGHSLATSLLLMATFPNAMLKGFDTTHWNTPWRENLASSLCVLLAIAITLRWLFAGRKADKGVLETHT